MDESKNDRTKAIVYSMLFRNIDKKYYIFTLFSAFN